MTNEELQKKLTSLKIKLSEAVETNNQELADKYVDELNSLWEKASIHMEKNRKADEDTLSFKNK
jgi:RNase P subunit RPR2